MPYTEELISLGVPLRDALESNKGTLTLGLVKLYNNFRFIDFSTMELSIAKDTKLQTFLSRFYGEPLFHEEKWAVNLKELVYYFTWDAEVQTFEEALESFLLDIDERYSENLKKDLR